MKQTSDITRTLTTMQEQHAQLEKSREFSRANDAMQFTLWTEDKGFGAILELLKRYFPDGATITEGHGVYLGGSENALEIKIVALRHQLQHVINLAGDIKTMNRQTSVLVTWQAVGRLDV